MNRFIGFIILIIISFQINAQIILEQEGKKAPLENMILQVKQLDEFMNRFNYKQDFFGNKINENFKSQFPRDKYIDLLFNNQDPRLSKTSNKFSQEYLNTKNKFINQVISGEGLYINKLSDKIFAIAECKLNYKGKVAKATLILNMETNSNSVKWVIRKVDAEFLKLESTNTISNSIPPNSNETNFISLKRSLDKKNNLLDISGKQFEYNQLSVFYYLVSKGEIKFEYVEKLKYLVLDINDWAITLNYYARDSENSGWLIDNISRQKEQLKLYLDL